MLLNICYFPNNNPVSGAFIYFGAVELKGMALAAVTGVLLSILFYFLGKVGIMNEKYNPTAKIDDDAKKKKDHINA